MAQVDLVSSCAGGGESSRSSKIARESLTPDQQLPAEDHDDEEPEPDVPPESFWLSKDAEYDWFDQNAFYDRSDYSTKGNLINSNSQRLSNNNNYFKSRASIIGLPKTENTSYVVDATTRRNKWASNIRLFPKRSVSISKSTAGEPNSPKVSCMGRVKSSKRGRRLKSGTEKPAAEIMIRRRRTGGIFRCCVAVDILQSNRRTSKKQAIAPPPRKSRVTKEEVWEE